MNSTVSEIGLIGLAVMGQNLALNIADHGFGISVFNRTYSKTLGFLEENEETKNLAGFEKIDEFVNSLERPRKIVIMVQAGKATDAVIETLLPLLDEGDIVIDGGNAKWTDTIDREQRLRDKNLHFVGSGVSGGEEGARFGPSLMPGCSQKLGKESRIFGIPFRQKSIRIPANQSREPSRGNQCPEVFRALPT